MDATGIGLTILSTVTIINAHSGDVLESASQAASTVRLIKVSIIKMLGPNTEAGLAEAAVRGVNLHSTRMTMIRYEYDDYDDAYDGFCDDEDAWDDY